MQLQLKTIGWTFLLVFFFLSACSTDTEEIKVLEAARVYAQQNSDIAVNFEAESIQEEYARVRVIPKNPGEADEALLYLKKDKNEWKGIIIGTGFSPEDYQNLGIPEGIR